MATIYERKLKTGNFWTLQYTENGKRKRTALGEITEQQAKRKLLEFEAGVSEEKVESVNVPLFKDFADTYKNYIADTTSFKNYRRVEGLLDTYITPYMKGLRLDQVTLQHIESYVARRKTARKQAKDPAKRTLIKAATINKEIRTLKALYTYAIGRQVVTYSPATLIRKVPENDSKPVEFFTEEQLERLYDDEYHGHWWRLMASTGMRRGEALHLRWSDIHGGFVNIVSTEEERTKSGKWRKVPVGDSVHLALLQLWREQSGDKEATDYPNIGGKVFGELRPDSISQAAARNIKAANLTGSLHKFRHTYISQLAMKGVPLATIQRLAGHSTPDVTMRYMHLSPNYLRDLAEYH